MSEGGKAIYLLELFVRIKSMSMLIYLFSHVIHFRICALYFVDAVVVLMFCR